MPKISRQKLAALTGISEGTLHARTLARVIRPARGGGYDALPAVVALLKHERNSQAGNVARHRLMEAQAIAHIRRSRRHMRQHLTLSEFRLLFDQAFDDAARYIRRETSLMYDRMQAAGATETAARGLTGQAYDGLRRLMLGYRAFADELCKQIEIGLTDDQRLDDVIEKLRIETGLDDDDRQFPTGDAHEENEAEASQARAKARSTKAGRRVAQGAAGFPANISQRGAAREAPSDEGTQDRPTPSASKRG